MYADFLIIVADVKKQFRYLEFKKKIVLDSKKNKSLKVSADDNFWVNWHKPRDTEHVITYKSRAGYVIMYAGCLIIWDLNLQEKVCWVQMRLSTCNYCIHYATSYHLCYYYKK